MSADRYTDHAEGGATDSHRIDFICAGCEARYKVVHVKATRAFPIASSIARRAGNGSPPPTTKRISPAGALA